MDFYLLTCLRHSKQSKNEEMKAYFKALYSSDMVAPSELCKPLRSSLSGCNKQ